MYIVATCQYGDYVINSLDDAGDLLLDEDFLSEYGMLFDEGITGFRFGDRSSRNHPVELIVQYWDGYDYDETTLYLHKVKLIGEQL